MSFVDDIFAHHYPDRKLLAEAGFRREGDGWTLRGQVLFGHFRAVLRLAADTPPVFTLYDQEGEEYTLIYVESANGEFVRHVRDACAAWLTEVREKCFEKRLFTSPQAERLAEAMRVRHGDTQDDPWNGRYKGHVVFRKSGNRKWYALTMNIDGKHVGRPGTRCDVLVIRAGGQRLPLLLERNGFLPAYHMNRDSWVTMLLDGQVDDGEALAELEAARTLLEGGPAASASAWLVPANPKYFDLEAAFAADEAILWKQSTAIRPGDTVWLYVTAPVSAISYKCHVVETGIPYEYQDGNVRMDHVMRIRLEHRFSPAQFPLKSLAAHGIVSIRGPRRMPPALLQELEKSIGDTESHGLRNSRRRRDTK